MIRTLTRYAQLKYPCQTCKQPIVKGERYGRVSCRVYHERCGQPPRDPYWNNSGWHDVWDPDVPWSIEERK